MNLTASINLMVPLNLLFPLQRVICPQSRQSAKYNLFNNSLLIILLTTVLPMENPKLIRYARNTYSPESSFMAIHDAASATQTTDHFRAKPQPKRIAQQSASNISSRILDSSGDPSWSPSNNPTKYSSPVPIIEPDSGPSEIPNKCPSDLPKELRSSNPSNVLM